MNDEILEMGDMAKLRMYKKLVEACEVLRISVASLAHEAESLRRERDTLARVILDTTDAVDVVYTKTGVDLHY